MRTAGHPTVSITHFAILLGLSTLPALAAPPATTTIKLEKLKGAAGLSAEITPKGDVEHAYRWSDKNGTNYLLVGVRQTSGKNRAGERTKTRYIDIIHGVCDGGGACRQLRRMRDGMEQCEYDLWLDLEPKSVSVTDLDGNGLSEVTLLYAMVCRSDVGPASLKLMLLENGQKYAIRGSQKLIIDGEVVEKGEMKLDPEWNKAPAPFLSHAKSVWNRFFVNNPTGDSDSDSE